MNTDDVLFLIYLKKAHQLKSRRRLLVFESRIIWFCFVIVSLYYYLFTIFPLLYTSNNCLKFLTICDLCSFQTFQKSLQKLKIFSYLSTHCKPSTHIDNPKFVDFCRISALLTSTQKLCSQIWLQSFVKL